MRNLVLKIVLIVAVLGLSAWSVFPPKEKLRLGKDLRGGISLVYSIKMPEDAGVQARSEILQQVIEVLKDRVNPTGVLDISITPQGLDRIEVVMPLPSMEVRTLQTDYRNALDRLLSTARVDPADLEEALRAGNASQRYTDIPAIATTVAELQSVYDAARDARQRLQAARESGADATVTTPIEAEVAQTEIREEALRSQVIAMGIDEARLVRALSLSDERQRLKQPDGSLVLDEKGAPLLGPSPREVELTAIRSEFPHLAEAINNVVAAHDAYTSKRKGLDDPEDLMRLLRGAGVLEFRIAVQSSNPTGVNPAQMRDQIARLGPENTDSPSARWFKINDLKQWYNTPEQLALLEADPVTYFQGRNLVATRFNGDVYLLLYTTEQRSMVHATDDPWSMERAFRTADDLGRPAVGFALDQNGARKMSRLTAPAVGQPMAIVLDDQVFSAPTLNSQIAGNGQITGNFSDSEITYLIRVLAAGALGARLSPDPISMSVLGPSIGGDNLQKGLQACLLSVIVVGVYMVVYYFFAGVVANISLACVTLMIFGVMTMIDGMFTLPGLAGIALTIGMAVDSNVLIYERVREEMVNNKEDLRSALRIGFKRAFNTIVDGQLTNLIVCLVLIQVATAEVKGFAVTMTIGVLSTLFAAMVITRTIFIIYAEVLHFRTLPMLPTTVPLIARILHPNIDWMRKRYLFFGISGVLTIASMIGVFSLGSGMLDTEFRGGVALTFSTRPATATEKADGEADPANGRLLMSRSSVEEAVHSIGDQNPNNPILSELASASVLTVGDVTPDFRGTTFQVKVSNPRSTSADSDEANVADDIVKALVEKFKSDLEVTPELTFKGAGDRDHAAHTFVLEKDRLGDNIGQPKYSDPVGRFMGGVAVVVEGISPPATVTSLQERIDRMRRQPDFASAFGRESKVVGLDVADSSGPAPLYSSVAILVHDPDLDARKVDLQLWDLRLAQTEWMLTSTALQQASSLDEVNSFSSAVARTLSAQAVVATVLSMLGIIVYVWFRFGSLRYSLAAMVATAHDMAVALGALALSHWLSGTELGRALLIEEFRIDLNVVAAILTLIGYSLNDTIVILDRIRENRGKLPLASASVINESINQTMSRTFLTSSTTLLSILILYIEGGTGIRPFAFVLLVGLITGTYSSVAIAAPLVYRREQAKPEVEPRSELATSTL
ncbi:MAG: protein translocase subunit SecD [Phycisphaerales bacterium]|nr:protein translocase subunit SecD [Phycisphaerales bacterium]